MMELFHHLGKTYHRLRSIPRKRPITYAIKEAVAPITAISIPAIHHLRPVKSERAVPTPNIAAKVMTTEEERAKGRKLGSNNEIRYGMRGTEPAKMNATSMTSPLSYGLLFSGEILNSSLIIVSTQICLLEVIISTALSRSSP